MGWRGALRSLGAAARRAERAERRQQRELDRRRSQLAKLAAAELAAFQVADWQNYMARVATIHREASPLIDWHQYTTPYVDRSGSAAAQHALQAFRPSLVDKMLGPERGRQKLEHQLRAALEQEAAAEHAANETARLAHAVLGRDAEAMLHVIESTGCLAELFELGLSPAGTFPRPGLAESTLHAQDETIVPGVQLSVTSRGKLSQKKMPAALRTDTYKAYVCGVAVRAARELIAVLPLEGVLVHVERLFMNKATGHQEPKPVLSFYCPRAAVLNARFEYVGAYDFVVALEHRIKLKRNALAPIERLRAEEVGMPVR